MFNTTLHGNCYEVMQGLPAKIIHACVTSPPYFMLRDYKLPDSDWPAVTYCPMIGMGEVTVPAWRGQLGLEPDPMMFIGHLVLIFREVHRLLRDDGSVWLNMGDSYWSRPNGSSGGKVGFDGGMEHLAEYRRTNGLRKNRRKIGWKHKDQMQMPARTAMALQADGWYLRSDVIWSKPNPMPESCKDRPTKAHEYFYLLTKRSRYYYDAGSIAEPCSPNTHARLSQNVMNQKGSDAAHAGARKNGAMKAVQPAFPTGWDTAAGSHDVLRHNQPKEKKPIPGVGPKSMMSAPGSRQNASFEAATAMPVLERNKRSVWTVATQKFEDAHFATFPEELITPCILASCPEGGVVLDPFGGSGTVGQVAVRHRRQYLLIEMADHYLPMQSDRIGGTQIHLL